jgi:predicted alpha/beta-fold hydrolase
VDQRWPVEAVLYRTEPDVQVLVHAQRPDGEAKGEIVLVHGLEGSSASGYMQSMAYAALESGYATHRFNMRGCGGSEGLAVTSYHAGQTSDLLAVICERKRLSRVPLFLAGYSLGGNVVLKLAGELGAGARDLLAGVVAVSAPIELAAGVEALERRENRLYQARFVDRLKDRIRRKHLQAPELYTLEHLPKIRTVVEFDNYYTAPLFGFGTAANYFRTQSSNQFLDRIQTPTLMVHAKDDPLVPFRIYDHPAISKNTHLRMVAVDRGGHLGFLARHGPRFWLDELAMDWVEEILNKSPAAHVSY